MNRIIVKKVALLSTLLMSTAMPFQASALVTAISFDCNNIATEDLVAGDTVSVLHTFDQTGSFAHAFVRTGPNQLYSGVATTNYVAGVPTTVTQTLTQTPVPGTLRFAIAFFNDNVLVECPDNEVNLAITKSVNDTSPNIADTVTFSLLIENLSPNVATDVLVTDIVPAGLSYVPGTMTGIAPAVSGINPDQSSPTGTGLRWTISSLPAAPSAGSSTTLTFQAVVNAP